MIVFHLFRIFFQAEEQQRKREAMLRQHVFFQLRIHLISGHDLKPMDKNGKCSTKSFGQFRTFPYKLIGRDRSSERKNYFFLF